LDIGIDSFAANLPDPATGKPASAAARMADLIDEIEVADRVGLDVFGIGEHHRPEFLDSAPAVILAAAAARTKKIRLSSAVTVLSAADPVRVFQEFATLDLISQGRAEIIVGRGSFGEAYPLFGYKFEDYDDLFVEKLDLLLKLRESANVTWSGRFRSPLNGQGIYPRPLQQKLPTWVGVGGTPESFARAGTLGLPLMVAIIGGEFRRFRPLVDLYREAGRRAGHAPETLQVGLHAVGFVAETTQQAKDVFFPGWLTMVGAIGRERGWSPPSRAQFDAMAGPHGAYLIGDPTAVAEKMLKASETLGGVSRVTFQMSVAALDHQVMTRAIELLGAEVAPRVRAAHGEDAHG
jgi:probable LLM family oxidoreductase